MFMYFMSRIMIYALCRHRVFSGRITLCFLSCAIVPIFISTHWREKNESECTCE